MPARRKSVNAAHIRLLVLDVDGVLTDGKLYFGTRGEALKVFHVRDGLGLRALQQAGVMVAVISGRRSIMVQRRCRELGIVHLKQGHENKLPVFQQLLRKLKVPAEHCACIGDDTSDVPLLQAAGLAFAVADAHPSAIHAAQRTTRNSGGQGAVREVCDYLLAARGLC